LPSPQSSRLLITAVAAAAAAVANGNVIVTIAGAMQKSQQVAL